MRVSYICGEVIGVRRFAVGSVIRCASMDADATHDEEQGCHCFRKPSSVNHRADVPRVIATIILMQEKLERSETMCTFDNNVNILHTVSLMVSP